MNKIILLLLLIAYTNSFSQSSMTGFIVDKKTNDPLPYATIKIISSSNYYTITNEDGKFEISNKIVPDSLEVRFIGYETQKIPISYFKNNTKLFLTQNIYSLNTVLIVAQKKKDYAYNLLFKLISKYRNKKQVTKSKAFFNLTSSTRGVPLEIIEGFYNSEQSLSNGIIDLNLKTGRFGQNKSFHYYNLNNTTILKDFQFFNKSNQILPIYPGNLSLRAIKSKYIVKFEKCNSCNNEDLSISFIPKKMTGKLFFGKIIFNKKNLTIKKIELNINDPLLSDLFSINQNNEIVPKEINLNINFNPIDYDKIQSIEYKFVVYFKSNNSFEVIQSNSFLYFYDYNKSFKQPYFTSKIHFNNDYDKIIALQATNDFWETNYQFPKSFKEKESLDFLKTYGNLINYENVISTNDMEFTRPSVISWNKNKRLEWDNIENELIISANSTKKTNRKLNTNIKADKVYRSTSEFVKNSSNFSNSKSFNFSYLLDSHTTFNGTAKYNTRTIFDRNSSFFKNRRSKNMLVYLNLTFDIYELYRQKLDSEIHDNMAFNKVIKLCDENFKEASITIEKMQKETNTGLNFQHLIKWNNTIKSKLDIDNYKLISN